MSHFVNSNSYCTDTFTMMKGCVSQIDPTSYYRKTYVGSFLEKYGK